RRLLIPIGLASIESCRRGRRVGDVEPFDTIDFCHLASRCEARRLLARYVIDVFDEDGLVTGFPLLLDEFERSGADRLGDLLVGVGLGEPLGHHERHVAGEFAERIENQWEWRFQAYRKGL